jgi:hypothetical protein
MFYFLLITQVGQLHSGDNYASNMVKFKSIVLLFPEITFE